MQHLLSGVGRGGKQRVHAAEPAAGLEAAERHGQARRVREQERVPQDRGRRLQRSRPRRIRGGGHLGQLRGGELLLGPQAHEERGVALDQRRAREGPVALVPVVPDQLPEPECLVLERMRVFVGVRDLLERADGARLRDDVHVLGVVVVEPGNLAREQVQVHLLEGRAGREELELVIQGVGGRDQLGRVVLPEALAQVRTQPGHVEHAAGDGSGCRDAAEGGDLGLDLPVEGGIGIVVVGRR